MIKRIFFVFLLTATTTYAGGIPVIDVASIAQSIIQVTKQVEQIAQLGEQITQLNERINQAKQNLEGLGVVIGRDTKQDILNYQSYVNGTLRALGGQRFKIDGVLATYTELYEKEEPTLEDSQVWLAEAWYAVKSSYQLQAVTISGLDSGNEILNKLLNLIMDSGGNLQALQALGQHITTTNEQLKQMRTEMAVESRRRAAREAWELAEEKRIYNMTLRNAGVK